MRETTPRQIGFFGHETVHLTVLDQPLCPFARISSSESRK